MQEPARPHVHNGPGGWICAACPTDSHAMGRPINAERGDRLWRAAQFIAMRLVLAAEDNPGNVGRSWKRSSSREANSGNGAWLPARGQPRRCESALQNPLGALRAPPGAHRGNFSLTALKVMPSIYTYIHYTNIYIRHIAPLSTSAPRQRVHGASDQAAEDLQNRNATKTHQQYK